MGGIQCATAFRCFHHQNAAGNAADDAVAFREMPAIGTGSGDIFREDTAALFQFTGVSDILSLKFDTAEKIDLELNEFYVVAKDYSWTYI